MSIREEAESMPREEAGQHRLDLDEAALQANWRGGRVDARMDLCSCRVDARW
jgi:hypothetical protein